MSLEFYKPSKNDILIALCAFFLGIALACFFKQIKHKKTKKGKTYSIIFMLCLCVFVASIAALFVFEMRSSAYAELLPTEKLTKFCSMIFSKYILVIFALAFVIGFLTTMFPFAFGLPFFIILFVIICLVLVKQYFV